MGDDFKNVSNSKIVNRSNVTNSKEKQAAEVSANESIWYKKPVGIIVIGVLVFLIGRFISSNLGW